MKINQTKLYNVVFPIWFIWVYPQTWIYIILGNFLIDSVIYVISMNILKMENKMDLYKGNIFAIFMFGLLSDFFGSMFILLLNACGLGVGSDDYLYISIAVLISAVLIFVFNYFCTFRDLNKRDRLVLSLIFSILTPPYTFFFPYGL